MDNILEQIEDEDPEEIERIKEKSMMFVFGKTNNYSDLELFIKSGINQNIIIAIYGVFSMGHADSTIKWWLGYLEYLGNKLLRYQLKRIYKNDITKTLLCCTKMSYDSITEVINFI